MGGVGVWPDRMNACDNMPGFFADPMTAGSKKNILKLSPWISVDNHLC
jgi:hypothetical protein